MVDRVFSELIKWAHCDATGEQDGQGKHLKCKNNQ